MKLLIALPTKTEQYYKDRAEACKATWLSQIPPAIPEAPLDPEGTYVGYRCFSDSDLGLVEINQHDNANDPIRTLRTKGMVQWAYDNGFDYIFRVDADNYTWVNRLLASGFEQHDYMGYCVDYPPNQQKQWCLRTAHGGLGFFLSRKAMKVVIDAPVDRYADNKYWGDLWAGQHLWKAGINCHRDTRFLDGSNPPIHHANIVAEDFTDDHPYISVHPVPIPNMIAIHERFANLPAETVPPLWRLWDK